MGVYGLSVESCMSVTELLIAHEYVIIYIMVGTAWAIVSASLADKVYTEMSAFSKLRICVAAVVLWPVYTGIIIFNLLR